MKNNTVLDDLRREVGRIAGGGGTWQDITKPTDYRAFTPAPPDERLRVQGTGSTQTSEERGPFGRWLLRQPAIGVLGKLVDAAKGDRQFPRDGDPEAVRARLRECMAEGDMFEAVDDAELDWVSY